LNARIFILKTVTTALLGPAPEPPCPEIQTENIKAILYFGHGGASGIVNTMPLWKTVGRFQNKVFRIIHLVG
jgi:hypothetical protein